MQASVIEAQNDIYSPGRGPPVLPHGDDKSAARFRIQLRAKRRKLTADVADKSQTPSNFVKPLAPGATPPALGAPRTQQISDRTCPELAPEQLRKMFPASELPAGFPPELAFRALAAYSTIRTLSVHLRLSPFTPNVFLRALLFPFPNRLFGNIHVAILRILLPSLHMGYHWPVLKPGQKQSSPPLQISKKRKKDGLRWPLRAGDNLEYLDHFTWPLFCDDYAHLIADVHYASWNHTENYVDMKNLDISMVQSDLLKGEGRPKGKLLTKIGAASRNRGQPTPTAPAIIYLNGDRSEDEHDDDDADELHDDDDADEFKPLDDDHEDGTSTTATEIDEDESFGGHTKQVAPRRGRGRPRKRPLRDLPSSTRPRKMQKIRPQTCKIEKGTHALNGVGKVVSRNKKLNSTLHESSRALFVSPGRKIAQPSPFLPFSYNTVYPPPEKGQLTRSHSNLMGPFPAVGSEMTNLVQEQPSQPNGKSQLPLHRGDVMNGASHQMRQDRGFGFLCLETRNEITGDKRTSTDSATLSAASGTSPQSHLSPTDGPPYVKRSGEKPDSSCATTAATATEIYHVAKFTRPVEVGAGNSHSSTWVSSISKQSNLEPAEGKRNGENKTRFSSLSNPQLAQHEMKDDLTSMALSKQSNRPLQLWERYDETTVDGISRTLHEAPEILIQNFIRAHATEDIEGSIRAHATENIEGSIRGRTRVAAPPRTGETETKSEIDSDIHDLAHGRNGINSGCVPLTDLEKETLWPHFEALETMRTGTPYHRLSVERKLHLLEFLIDDLLALDSIAAEMSRRHDANACFEKPYGSLPFSNELAELVNEDFCAVCRKEGDLLCCDGCISSFHRECIGVSQNAPLPEGSWYCPECSLVDSAKYGPLKGGRKSRLDWFSIPIDSQVPREDNSKGSQEPHGLSEFLVVHGFVFRRQRDSLGFPGRNQCWVPPGVLCGKELRKLFCGIGHGVSSSWPLVHIPCDKGMIWEQVKGKQIRPYLLLPESFDPNAYKSLYRRAPLDGVFRRVKDAHLATYEEQCCSMQTQSLSSRLSVRMDRDDAIVRSLTENVDGDYSFQLVRGYMTSIERNLCKSHLLEESWGIPKSGKSWVSKVGACSSVNGLSRLLVALVDGMHPRVFGEGWYRCPTAKQPDIVPEAGNWLVLRSDFQSKTAIQKQNWERCRLGHVRGLLNREGRRLVDWISELRPDLSVRQRSNKRKYVKDRASSPSRASPLKKLTDRSLVEAHLHKEPNQDLKQVQHPMEELKQEHGDGGPTKTDGRRVLRRSNRASLDDQSSHVEAVVGAEELESMVMDEMQAKLEAVAQGMNDSYAPEQFWPV